MTRDSKRNLNLPIYEQAADWLIDLREGEIDVTTRERWAAGFRASPEHIRAYLELAAIWEEGADADLDRTHTTDNLIAIARGTSNVIALSGTRSGVMSEGQDLKLPATPRSVMPEVRRARPHRSLLGTQCCRRPLWAAALGIAFVVGSAGLYFHAQRDLDFETGIGEQRFVQLVDGSTMELNSRSRVEIRYSGLERNVDLIDGQALFHVAKDSARPFIVHSGATLVRAVGTQFDVYRKDSGTTVSVVEGRVAVLSPLIEARSEGSPSGSATAPKAPVSALIHATEPRARASSALPSNSGDSVASDARLSNAADAIYLSAGEQVTVSAQGQPRATHTDPTVATAWTQHELVFDSTPLVEVAQDFNRYNTRQLIVKDPALASFHVTGVFSSADPASLLKFLRAQRDIKVEETDDGIHVSKK